MTDSRRQTGEAKAPAGLNRAVLSGLAATMGAFVIWGLSPLYWRLLGTVPAAQIALHRMVWSGVFLAPLLFATGPREDVCRILRRRLFLGLLVLTAILVASNWLIYIWAVTHGRVLEASLGYYINPLVSVGLGLVFLREHLRPAQWGAVGLAAGAVVVLAVWVGTFPWLALGLAGSFGLYGLLRKRAAIRPSTGLMLEALLLSGPALPLLILLDLRGEGVFCRVGLPTDLLLMAAGPFTALPLLLFNYGAKRLTLATVGLMQYIAPTLMFLIAVAIFDEPLSKVRLAVFALIWVGLVLYSIDAWRSRRQPGPGQTDSTSPS